MLNVTSFLLVRALAKRKLEKEKVEDPELEKQVSNRSLLVLAATGPTPAGVLVAKRNIDRQVDQTIEIDQKLKAVEEAEDDNQRKAALDEFKGVLKRRGVISKFPVAKQPLLAEGG